MVWKQTLYGEHGKEIMSKVLKIVGLDPSMSNFGIAVGTVDLDTNTVNIKRFELAETKAGGNKKTVRVNSDDLRRSSEIWKKAKPIVEDAHIVFCELPVGSQSSRAQTSYGICIGILACIEKPLIQLTPNEIKHYVGGRLSVSKEDIIDWAVGTHPDAPWLRHKVKGELKLTSKNEHLADAVAAIHAGMETDQFKQLVSMMKAIL